MENNFKAAIFLAPGYEMGEAIITIDVLKRANFQVDIVSVADNLLVTSSHNVEIKCEQTINQINFANYHVLILPGGSKGVANLNKNSLLKEQLIKFVHDRSKAVAAICAAPQILGQLNLVNNKEVTFYPGCEQGLQAAIKTQKPVVISNNIITGKSIGCAFHFALAIVSYFLGAKKAQQITKILEF